MQEFFILLSAAENAGAAANIETDIGGAAFDAIVTVVKGIGAAIGLACGAVIAVELAASV